MTNVRLPAVRRAHARGKEPMTIRDDSTTAETDPLGDRLMTGNELADFLAVAPKTIRQWRYLGVGPAPLKVGGHVRYDPREVRRWLADECRPNRDEP